ncbi:hypothetical protein ACIBG6_30545 [Streptomyces sp. NPDC050842]|uniref:hypothetical protein n=1 Tax=Streptomyces sp. NPDC050842 TaxID=3365636 RepID=UPI00379B69D4
MAVDALNSGARVWMADFEDATAPTWENVIGGQLVLLDAVERRLDFTSPEARSTDWARIPAPSRSGRAVSGSLYDEFKEPLYAPPPLLPRMVAVALPALLPFRGPCF